MFAGGNVARTITRDATRDSWPLRRTAAQPACSMNHVIIRMCLCVFVCNILYTNLNVCKSPILETPKNERMVGNERKKKIIKYKEAKEEG